MVDAMLDVYNNINKKIVFLKDIRQGLTKKGHSISLTDVGHLVKEARDQKKVVRVSKGVHKTDLGSLKLMSCRVPATYCILESLMSYDKKRIFAEDLRHRVYMRYGLRINGKYLQILAGNSSTYFKKTGFVSRCEGKEIVFVGRYSEKYGACRTGQMILDSFATNERKTYTEIVDMLEEITGDTTHARANASYNLTQLVRKGRLKRVVKGVYEKI